MAWFKGDSLIHGPLEYALKYPELCTTKHY